MTPAPSDERLRKIIERFRKRVTAYTKLLLEPRRITAAHLESARNELRDATDELERRSVTTQASEGSGMEALKKHLADHWLTGVTCDHDAKTDTAACSCSRWRDEPHPSVGAAVEAWIEHVFATLPAAPNQSKRVERLELADNGLTAIIIEEMRSNWKSNPAMPFAQRVAFSNICDAALSALHNAQASVDVAASLGGSGSERYLDWNEPEVPGDRS